MIVKFLFQLITAFTLFCVQPVVPNLTVAPEAVLHAPGPVTIDTHTCNEESCPATGQMPEIEVDHFGGEWLHATAQSLFDLTLTGKLQVFPVLLPHQHAALPLLRPPRA